MKKICIVSGKHSHGARDLVAMLVELGVDAVRATSKQPDRLNIGWGRPGDVNPQIPPNKLWELERCQEAGVQTVPFFLTPTPTTTAGARYVMGRNLRHTEGRDIVLYQRIPNGYVRVSAGPNAQERPDFYTVVVDKSAEYRIHVWFGKAVKYGKKTYRGEGESTTLIWNWGNNWKLDYTGNAEVPSAAWVLAKRAVKACGLDFGAVDVLQGKDGQLYFLEVNTRPGIEGQTILKYANKIKALAEESEA